MGNLVTAVMRALKMLQEEGVPAYLDEMYDEQDNVNLVIALPGVEAMRYGDRADDAVRSEYTEG